MSQAKRTCLVVMSFAVLFSWGCAYINPQPPPKLRFIVNVDSLEDSALSSGDSYFLLSAKEGVTTNDLLFRELAAYVRRTLSEKGFTEASSVDKADLAIFLNYGIGDPQTVTSTYSIPLYGVTGGGTSTYSGLNASGGLVSGTIHQPYRYGVVGSQIKTDTQTTYTRYFLLDAIDVRTYRRSKELKSAWRTTAVSTGTSGDLRRVFPYLVVAASPYIGTNTGRMIDSPYAVT